MNTVIFGYARTLSPTGIKDLYQSWADYLDRVGNQNIHAVKLDVADAYGNVNIELLIHIISIIPSWATGRKTNLIRHLNNRYVTLGKSRRGGDKVYKWNHGLLQGDQLSAALCEIYMSHLDNEHLKPFCNKPGCLIHRTVDDYLFCSTDPDDVTKFIKIMSTVHNLNSNKTQCTLNPHNDLEIEYCGRVINVQTRQIRGSYKFKQETRLRYRFKLQNINDAFAEESFFARAMYSRFNNYHFCKAELNTVFNTEDTVLENFFRAVVYLAHKYDAAVMTVYQETHMNSYARVLSDVVWHYSGRTLDKIIKFRGNNYTGSIKFLTLVKVAYQAFVLVLQRSTKYTHLIGVIKKVMLVIRLKHYKPHLFKRLPACFEAIKMSRGLNIVTE